MLRLSLSYILLTLNPSLNLARHVFRRVCARLDVFRGYILILAQVQHLYITYA